MITKILVILAALGIVQMKPTTLSGLVMPHHDLAAPVVMEILEKQFKDQKYELIVVLSPNHFEPKSTMFTTSSEMKDFPVREDLVTRMVEENSDVALKPQLVEGEHGVVVPMSYLTEFFSEAQFLPVLISPYYDPEKLEGLAEWMVTELPEKTLIVASVDFSHNNQEETALKNNDQAIEVISKFDFTALQGFDDNYMDSPAAMGTLMRVMQKRGTTKWETWKSFHGAEILGNPQLQGTSYVMGGFK